MFSDSTIAFFCLYCTFFYYYLFSFLFYLFTSSLCKSGDFGYCKDFFQNLPFRVFPARLKTDLIGRNKENEGDIALDLLFETF